MKPTETYNAMLGLMGEKLDLSSVRLSTLNGIKRRTEGLRIKALLLGVTTQACSQATLSFNYFSESSLPLMIYTSLPAKTPGHWVLGC